MAVTFTRPLVGRLAVLIAGSLLSACHIQANDPVELVTSHTFDHANWQQQSTVVRNQVEPISLVHNVTFANGQTDLSDEEVVQLHEFLQSAGVHDGARIEIDGPRSPDGYHDPATAARLSAIEAEISALGLESEVPERPITSLVRPDDGIAVAVTRAMVVLPDCSAPTPAFATRPDAVYSCANASALGMMIADPVDLARGRATGPADANTSVLSIQRYRKGETKPLKNEGTSSQ